MDPTHERIMQAIIEDPIATSKELAGRIECSLDELRTAYFAIMGRLPVAPNMPFGLSDVIRKILERDVLSSSNRRFLDAFRERKFVFPDRLELHLGSGCQCCCRFCWRWSSGEWKSEDLGMYPSAQLSRSKERWRIGTGALRSPRTNAGLLTLPAVENLLNEFKTNNPDTHPLLYLSGGLECFTSELAEGTIKKAAQLGFKTMVYTNGVAPCFDDDRFVDLLLEKTAFIRFSLHANTGETFARVQMPHRPSELACREFSNVRRHIENLLTRRGSRASGGPTIAVAYLIIGDNLDDLEGAIEWMQTNGVDECDVRVDMRGVSQWFDNQQRARLDDILRRVRQKSDQDGYHPTKVNSRFDDRYNATRPATRPMGERRCFIPLKKPTVDPWGYVLKCCYRAHPALQSTEFVLGKYPERSLCEILNDGFNSGDAPQSFHCADCTDWEMIYNKCVAKVLEDWEQGISPDDLPR